jgi:hypothetical protein
MIFCFPSTTHKCRFYTDRKEAEQFYPRGDGSIRAVFSRRTDCLHGCDGTGTSSPLATPDIADGLLLINRPVTVHQNLVLRILARVRRSRPHGNAIPFFLLVTE